MRVERGQDIDARIESSHQLVVHLGLLFLLVVDHFHHIPIKLRHDAHLGQLPPLGDAGFDLDGQSGWHQFPRFLKGPLSQRLCVVDEEVAPLDLVLVLGQLRASGESGRISVVGFQCCKKRDPVLMRA